MTTSSAKKSASKSSANPMMNLKRLSDVVSLVIGPNATPDAYIDIDKIYSKVQVRTIFKDIESLAASFRSQKRIHTPLALHKESDGRFRVIFGERRLRAAPLADLTKVPAIIFEGLSEREIRAMQVSENNDRENLTAYDEAMGVIKDVEEYGAQDAMVIWNHGESWISKRMAVKRYATPVRELLENELCGDFEVLHCLSQIYDIDETHADFDTMRKQVVDGAPLSRDEARNTLTRLKTWKKQQDDMEQRRLGLASAPKPTPRPVEEQSSKDAARDTETPTIDSTTSIGQGDQIAPVAVAPVTENLQKKTVPARVPTPEEKAAAEQERAAEGLLIAREQLFEQGESLQTEFAGLKSQMTVLDHDMRETEWVLWSSFLTVTLPMLEGIGPERAVMYLKKLQGELKGKTPMQKWAALHPDIDGAGRDPCPSVPADWRF